jgi:glutathionylspermidine synthase
MLGINWHSEDSKETWNEKAVYLINKTEVQRLCQAARELADIYDQAAAHIISKKLWSLIGLREHESRLITASWEKGEWSLHGRFDFLFDEEGNPKLLEYNAETALSLVETALAQRQWLAEVMPSATQFNEIEEKLLLAWQASGFGHVHCAWRPRHAEVEGTVRFMAGIMRKAGVPVTLMAMHRMGWHPAGREFVDHDGVPIRYCYKLYPWEWMLREPFAKHVQNSNCSFIEPPWRLLLGSKGILCVISDMFGDHPSVVASHTTPAELGTNFVSKPMFGHEGHNVSIHRNGEIAESLSGEYGDEPKVFQAFVESPRYEGYLPQFGVWMVRGEPAAICVRESRQLIISANSALVPHAVESMGVSHGDSLGRAENGKQTLP